MTTRRILLLLVAVAAVVVAVVAYKAGSTGGGVHIIAHEPQPALQPTDEPQPALRPTGEPQNRMLVPARAQPVAAPSLHDSMVSATDNRILLESLYRSQQPAAAPCTASSR
jgi:hypothetical protein